MKALPFKVPRGSKSSIKIDHEVIDQFYPNYHTHEEIQLTYVIKGEGTAFVGDRIIEFSHGDIFLFGRHLPHVFKDHQGNGIESISVFFLRNFLGDDFLEIPETSGIKNLIDQSSRGIRITDEISETMADLIRDLKESSGINQIILLIQILSTITFYKNEFITGPDYQKPRRQIDGEKINDVFNYLTANYERDISLGEIAEIAHMSPTAFCRYFKQHTRKSYSQFLTEIRIGQACKLLMEKSDSISQVAFSSGFNNISNFNRQFKKITGTTPSAYQQITI